MARRPGRKPAARAAVRAAVIEDADSAEAGESDRSVPPPGTTGRFLVLFKRDAVAQGAKSLARRAGIKVTSTADFKNGVVTSELGGADALVFPTLGVAVVDRPPEEMHGIAAAAAADDDAILAIEPERIVRAIGDGVALDYFRGYRDAVNTLYDKLTGPIEEEDSAAAAAFRSETEYTWGLQATRVPASAYSGRGIGVAVLDTGIDTGHPDFTGRAITTASFVQGQSVQDGNGHGTHCIGTACGPKQPGTLPRYGIAHEANIFAGKVLSNQGSGTDSGILGGMQWAIDNGCAIVSMSLGAPVEVGEPFSQVFEHAARRSLAAGTLIIAAAGNESQRPQVIKPVGHPANCPSIMAVAAVDRRLRVAPFSCGGLNPQGGQVDIAGPGVDVRSSWPRPTLYNTISGTSMATPHVAGVAALYAESDASFRGRTLMSILTQYARRLSAQARDVGTGLVQAP